MITRVLAAVINAWLALTPLRGLAAVAWRSMPGDLLGQAVVRLCGVTAPSRRVQLADGTEALLYEDARLGLYLDNVPLRPYAQTLGRIVVAREAMPAGTIRHELEHVRQWRRLGPLFLVVYGLESMRVMLMGGHRYRDNRYELAARARETDLEPKLTMREITGR